MSFWQQYWHVILFYSVVLGIIYLNRSKFEFQGKLVGLLRTNTGVKWMKHHGEKYSTFYKVWGEIGVWVGFTGMLIITGYLGYGLYELIANPNAPPVVSPVLPGITIPGTSIQVPLFAGLIALFIVVVVHEAAHGVVANAHKLKVHSSGVGFLGPIPVAFVEPDEKQLTKASAKTQLRVFAAGPWSNINQAILAFALLFLVGLAYNATIDQEGIYFDEIVAGSPAELAGLQPNTVYTTINNKTINTTATFLLELQNVTPGQNVTLDENLITIGALNNTNSSCVGVVGLNPEYADEDKLLSTGLLFIQDIIYWVFVLSLGLGLANLMPLGPVDGGRMIYHPIVHFFGVEKGEKIWGAIATGLIFVLLVLLIVPIIKGFIGPEQLINACLPA